MAARLESRLTLLLLQSEEVFLPGRPALWQQEDTPTWVDRESSLNGLAHYLPDLKELNFWRFNYRIFCGKGRTPTKIVAQRGYSHSGGWDGQINL